MERKFRIFVNFKTYPQGTGERAVELAKICSDFSDDKRFKGIEIIPVVQVVDVYRIKKEVGIPIWVQHIDPYPQGQFTGWQSLEAVMEAGASGTLLNHSEHPIPPGTIKQIISRISKLRFLVSNFEVMVCCKTLGQMERLVKLKPSYIGYEVSELIGGRLSIVDYNPKAIGHAREICGDIPLVVGAGIHRAEDLKRAKELNCAGVLLSSAFVLSNYPKYKLKELLSLII